eukprot:TRINITY_DN11980_c0_g6_i1.p1 TRINITY_DN11980_c0_g6~~TRINITY_DN11980_c0_g6_i1.p1  ORF type:complete len:402 (-),score=69.07 TRINITY_DN11980_c0_g6_i1:145-1350(-)
MAGIKIFHTSKNYNQVLPGQSPQNDQDIGVRALWTSVATADASEPCCVHHPRTVSLLPELFLEWALDDEKAEWTLLYVCENSGEARGHKFHKYVLLLSEHKDTLLKKCKGSHKYEVAFTARTKSLFNKLGKFYEQWFRPAKNKGTTNHFHIGILGGSPFDHYQDENATEWQHLRPEPPKVHRRESDGEVSEPESLTFSEIFKKFAFENDDQREEEWVAVRSKNKAKDGCLPFCFEANTNIFPDYKGVFRHYCRADATWACKRKGCGQTSKEEEGKVTRTTWRSFNSWYHQHLKDHEGQGLRKGFERQYCKQCWAKSKEWVEGKICAFSKPGDRDDDDKGKKRPPHDQEMCEMCQRLKRKGFDQSCFMFSNYVNRGDIVVEEGDGRWKFTEDAKARQAQRKW